MFIFNLKINRNKFLKIFKFIIIVLAIIIIILSIFTIFQKSKSEQNSFDKIQDSTLKIESNNYTNFLKECHENINKYLDKKVKITGYVYRLPDFSDNQFVLARTMLINSNSQAVVVGILSEFENAKDIKDYSWIEISGTIVKGNYYGELPILKANEIKETQTPEEEFVHEPTD